MRSVFITFVFSIVAILIAQNLVRLQLRVWTLRAFMMMVVCSVALLIQPQASLYLVIGSITFYDPCYDWPFIHLWLHQWIILASLIIFAGLHIYKRQKFHFLRLDLVLGLFFVTFIISYVNSTNIALSLKWTTYFCILLGGYFLLRLTISSEKQLAGVIAFLIFCGAVSGSISFFYPTVGERVGSLVFRNPNALGNYLTLILPLALAFLFHGQLSGLKRSALFLATGAIATSIVLTLSRSSWAGCILGVLMLGFIKPKVKYFAVIIPALFFILLIPPVKKRLVEDKNDPGVYYRQTKIKAAYQMFKENPILGQGPGTFQALAPESEEWAVYAHSAIENLYLRILAEGGLVQAFVFIGLLFYINYLGSVTLKSLPPGFLQTAVIGSLAAFWAALGIGIGEDVFLFPKSNWLIGLYLAIIIKVRELSGFEKNPD